MRRSRDVEPCQHARRTALSTGLAPRWHCAIRSGCVVRYASPRQAVPRRRERAAPRPCHTRRSTGRAGSSASSALFRRCARCLARSPWGIAPEPIHSAIHSSNPGRRSPTPPPRRQAPPFHRTCAPSRGAQVRENDRIPRRIAISSILRPFPPAWGRRIRTLAQSPSPRAPSPAVATDGSSVASRARRTREPRVPPPSCRSHGPPSDPPRALPRPRLTQCARTPLPPGKSWREGAQTAEASKKAEDRGLAPQPEGRELDTARQPVGLRRRSLP